LKANDREQAAAANRQSPARLKPVPGFIAPPPAAPLDWEVVSLDLRLIGTEQYEVTIPECQGLPH